MRGREIIDRFRELRSEAADQNLESALTTENLISLTVGSVLREALDEIDRSLVAIAQNVS